MVVLHEGLNELNVDLVPIDVPPPMAELRGQVTDSITDYPLSMVKVTIDGVTTYTDSSGLYGFADLEPGSYTITFEKEGYDTLVR